ncbi:MAG: DUF1648 domain-containing protein [Ignavibacteriales bacterium]|nr:DUF1648 domain-containing protein [Ignavibacteriales bacterium]
MSGKNAFLSWWHISTVLLAFTVSLCFYLQLPATIPVHFDASGTPDSWAKSSVFSWFLLNAISWVLVLLFYGVSRFIRKKPHLINIPHREMLLALPLQKREPVFLALDTMSAQISCTLQVLFITIQWGSFQVASGAVKALPAPVLHAIFGSSTVTLIIVVLQLNKIEIAIKKASA